MASPSSVPHLRPPVPPNRARGSGSMPRLGLSIPVSPHQRPVDHSTLQIATNASSGAAPPPLLLSTPMGTKSTPEEHRHPTARGHLPPLILPVYQTSSNTTPHSRSGSSGDSLNPISAATSDSPGGDPGRRDSTGFLPDLAKLSIEKGRPLDVEDLDDAGWLAASNDNMIKELGSLGEGAGGAVTRCILEGSKTVFALKVITTNPDPDVKKQILRELNFNKNCVSEHICRYYGAFMNDAESRISIAMEFCEGGSLDSVYRQVKSLGGRTGEKVLGKIAEGVLNGLTYLQQKHRIIHRDIKPSNVLLCRNGQVKLCDFGVSGETGTNGAAETFIGTSYYMAPERISGQQYTITSDVWSLGVTLLEVAQNRFPFPADDDGSRKESHPTAGLFDLLTYIVKSPVPKLRDEPEHKLTWSNGFKSFIEYCLEKDGARRATPWRMLEHPWIVEMKTKRVNMEKFLGSVWNWQD